MSIAAPLIVFADDWGRHPSSCQHLVSRILDHRPVVWVNTIGTRPPRLNWATMRRGLEKVRQWTGLASEGSEPPDRATHQGTRGSRSTAVPNPLVLNPRMWPSFRSHFARGLNRRLLLRAIEPLAAAALEPPVVITTLPILADLVGRFPAARWVYYCVDDFSVWPGLDGRTMGNMEVELVRKVDVAIAASETLQTRLAALGKNSHLLTHGVDLNFWRRPIASSEPPPAWHSKLDHLEKPLVVYWGVVDRRLDVSFIRALSEALTAGTILFVGPQDDPEPALSRLSRVSFLPAVPYAELPHLAASASVLIAPYGNLPVTRAMQPLKLKEYLATGKPAVARRLPATAQWADCADEADTAAEFSSAVVSRLKEGLPPEQRIARERLVEESWEAKAKEFELMINLESF